MQLLALFAALLLFGGPNAAPPDSEEMLEIFKYALGDNAEKVLGEAEKLSGVLSLLAPPNAASPAAEAAPKNTANNGESEKTAARLILEPIAPIADGGIYSALSRAL